MKLNAIRVLAWGIIVSLFSILLHFNHTLRCDEALLTSAMQGDIQSAEEAISRGCDINCLDQKGGSTPLILAASAGHPLLVDLFLRNGADLNVQNAHGNTALMLSAEKGYTDIVSLLLRAGARRNMRNSEGRTAFELAQRASKQKVIKLLY